MRTYDIGKYHHVEEVCLGQREANQGVADLFEVKCVELIPQDMKRVRSEGSRDGEDHGQGDSETCA